MIVARVRRTLRERALVSRGARVLVACSGGPDSAALLDVLHRLAPELELTLFAASVDHGLRPDAALDVEVAGALAARLGVPFSALSVRIESDGASVQAKARRARYAALLAEAERVGAGALAVGHTLDDQAETVLSRILRGSGVVGLSGIEPKRDDGVIRPLIDCRREDVHAHVARHALPYRNDPSNESASFERVRLRRTILPALAEEDPAVTAHLARLADDARGLRALARAAANELLMAARLEPGALDAGQLRAAAPPVRSAALSAWVLELTGQPASRAHLESLERTLESRGETLLKADLRARLEDGALRAHREPGAPTRSRRGPSE